VAPERVVAEVSEAVAHGAQEVVLSGINLGSYRWDEQGLRLPELLELLLERTEVGRLRLSSIEPPDVDAELLRVMAESGGRVAPFLHMCLQAGSDRTLRRMARVYDTALYRERVEMARERIEGLALGCDLIVGFPGETDADFEESLAFCREMAFAKMHVFRYSRRPGTPAASMPDQVDPRVMAQRSIRMRELADVSRATYAQSRLGCDELVLVQEPGRGVSGGLLDVLVDEGLALGSLARVRVRGIAGPDVLDARTSA
jgi:threonylcarbamoyladenosine tRNA methylthiotransferase MtaB